MTKRKFNFDSITNDTDDIVVPPETSTPSRPVLPTPQPQKSSYISSLSKKTEPDMQISIKGPQSVIERFKLMSMEDRRAYWDMLKILMDKFEKQ